MGYKNLQECVTDLEKAGRLIRIDQPLDPHLEIGALQRRINYVDLRYSNGFAVRIQELRGEPRENVRGTAARSPVKPEKKG